VGAIVRRGCGHRVRGIVTAAEAERNQVVDLVIWMRSGRAATKCKFATACRGRPARTSEIREAVVRCSPESEKPIYGCLGELITAGQVKRVSTERDALIAIKN
jgi:hypothetical protein